MLEENLRGATGNKIPKTASSPRSGLTAFKLSIMIPATFAQRPQSCRILVAGRTRSYNGQLNGSEVGAITGYGIYYRVLNLINDKVKQRPSI